MLTHIFKYLLCEKWMFRNNRVINDVHSILFSEILKTFCLCDIVNTSNNYYTHLP